MRPRATAASLLAVMLATGLGACSSGSEERRVAGLVSAEASFQTLTVCHGTGCAERSEVRLDENDWSKIDAVFMSPATSAADERSRIAIAIGIMEVLVGPQSGTARDIGRNQHSGNRTGQLDCVDEAVNSTTYLRLIADRGVLRYHDVAPPANRILDLVDINNLASLRHAHPISVFDAEALGPELAVRFGRAGESYVFNSSGQSMGAANHGLTATANSENARCAGTRALITVSTTWPSRPSPPARVSAWAASSGPTSWWRACAWSMSSSAPSWRSIPSSVGW